MPESFARIYTVLMVALFVVAFTAPDTPLFWGITSGMGVTLVAWGVWEWRHRNDPDEMDDDASDVQTTPEG